MMQSLDEHSLVDKEGLQQNLVDPVDLTTLREEEDVVGSDLVDLTETDVTGSAQGVVTTLVRDEEERTGRIPGNFI